jgi:L-asparaginase
MTRASRARRVLASLLSVALAAVVAAPLAPLAAQENTPRTLPRVHVLATGGTISNTGGQDRLTVEQIVASVPGLPQLARVSVEQFSNTASGSITFEHWRGIAQRLRALQAEPDPPAGVVVTHGTDTMEETAWFLHLTVGGCMPVVVTGAMRNAGMVAPDGPANLWNSARVAIAPQARGRGTMVLIDDVIFGARDVVKSNTTRTDAFSSPNEGPLGVADPDSVAFRDAAPPPSCRTAPFDPATLAPFPRVDVIASHVEADSVPIDALVAAGARGLVVSSIGRGGTTPAQGRALRRAVERGVIVVVSNRTGSGRVGTMRAPDDWQPGQGMMLSADALNPQKARVLLLLALASSKDQREAARKFLAR